MLILVLTVGYTSVSKRVEDINRNLVDSITIDTPAGQVLGVV